MAVIDRLYQKRLEIWQKFQRVDARIVRLGGSSVLKPIAKVPAEEPPIQSDIDTHDVLQELGAD